MLAFRRNKFAFPGGTSPGFDSAHPAAMFTRFSAIMRGGGCINLLTGQHQASIAGTVPAGLDPTTGPYCGCSNANYFNFTGMYGTNDTAVTIAGITTLTGTAGNQFLIDTNSGATLGNALSFGSASSKWAFNGVTSTLAPTVNRPYFVMGSGDTVSGSAMVMTDLLSGKISVSSGLGAITAATSGTSWEVGAWNGHTGTQQHNMAAIMYSSQKLPLGVMLQWASDPWAFWYPRKQKGIDIVGVIAAAAARAKRFALLGVGG